MNSCATLENSPMLRAGEVAMSIKLLIGQLTTYVVNAIRHRELRSHPSSAYARALLMHEG